MLPPAQAAAVAEYQRVNQPHIGPWDPPRPPEFFTAAWWETRLARNLDDFAEDRGAQFQILDKETGDVIGVCNFTGFVRGAFQACQLGYNISADRQGQGYMSEALRAAIPFVFDELRLHRIQASYVPWNERSGRLLERLGFVVEGRAKDYLYIDGQWRDHVLTALTNPDPRPPTV